MMEKREKIPYFERRVEAKDKVFCSFLQIERYKFFQKRGEKKWLGKSVFSPRKWI
jgi:hypothetical protein